MMEISASFAWAADALAPRSQARPHAEADHRIANSLSQIASLVRMRGSAIDSDGSLMAPEEVKALLIETAGRIHAVATLHRMLSHRDGGDVEVGPYIRQITEALVETLTEPGKVTLEVDCARDCACRPEVASSIGLMVSELVINALKYAHPTGVGGTIRVACRRDGDCVAIEVGDDGVGLPAGIDPSVDGHVGLKLVRSLLRQVRGEASYRTDDLGLTVQIRVPLR